MPGLKFVQRFIAPLGYSIHVLFHQIVPPSCEFDRFSFVAGFIHCILVCEIFTVDVRGESVCENDGKKGFIEVRDHYADRNGTWWQFCEVGHHQDTPSHLAITSYLNTITVNQISDNSRVGVTLNASLSVIPGQYI